MRKRPALPVVPLIFSATLLTLPLGLHAAETKQIARSSKLGIELFGIGGDTWCKTDAQLHLSRSADSPLIGKEETLFPKIAKIFDTECPEMKTAKVIVQDASGTTTRDFRITKASGWTISNDAPVVADTDTSAPPPKTATAENAESKDTKTAASQSSKSPAGQADATPEQQTQPPAVVEKSAPEEKPISLTRENVFFLAAKYYPEALENGHFIDQLASLKSCAPYTAVWNNEFDLRDWRKTVKPDIAAKSKATSDLFEFTYNMRVRRRFDFDKSTLDIGTFIPKTLVYEKGCPYDWSSNFKNNAIGGTVKIYFEDLPDSFNPKIYLPGNLGRSAVDRLEETGNKVRVQYRARIKDLGLHDNRDRHYKLKAEFVDVKIYAGTQFDYLLVHHDEAKFTAAREQHQVDLEQAKKEQRRAEEERLSIQRAHEEELRRIQREREDAQAQRLYDSLAGENAVPAKLAALYHDGNPSFDNPYDIAAKAFSRKRKFLVRAFVQVGSRDSIGYRAEWPSRVYLSGAELEEGEWYFVSGMGDGQKIDSSLHSIITVDEATKCDDRVCMQEADVIDYVRSQYPQWSGALE